MSDRDLTSPVALPGSDSSPILHMGREGSDILSGLRSPSVAECTDGSTFSLDLGAEYGLPPAPADDPSSRVVSSPVPGKERSGSVQNQALLDELIVAGPPHSNSGDPPPCASGMSTAVNSAAGSPVGGAAPKTSSGASSPSSPSKGYLIGPVQVRSSSIADVISRAIVTETPKNLPTALPLELKLPMALRCDFCIKFDSVCSQCHFKWKGILDSRRIVLFGNFSSVPDHRKVGVLFASICYGSVAFVRHFLEAWPSSVYWRSRFFPLPNTQPVKLDDVFGAAAPPAVAVRDAGQVYPLHVAFHARRMDMATLLFDLGSIVRKSDRGVAPMELLLTPMPDEWEALLDARDSFVEYNMKERAKRLRAEGHFADAALEYEALVARNPRNENARCGVAKMAIEQGRFMEATQLCRAILTKPTDVAWVEFDTKTVHALLQDATRRLHDECHGQPGPALKLCGCIITDKTVISLRRRKRRADRGQPEKQLLIEVFRDHIVPYCDCKMLWQLWQATRMPLLRRYAERIATASSIDTIGGMLAEEYGYAEMYDTLRQDMPPVVGKNAVLHNPMRLLGLQVTAMADFHTYFLRSAVLGANPHFVNDTGFFGFGSKKSSDRRMKLVATKDFRLSRSGIGKAFEVHDLAEWEVDPAATDRIINNIAAD